jgi:ubiquinone/menaquinone biosynthesis C-methylase UbiE
MKKYVHGYSRRETERLHDQSLILEELLHDGTVFPPGSRILEAGCGVGAQTAILSRRNPGADIVSIDISEESLNIARARSKEGGGGNVYFLKGDILRLPFPEESFDHAFVCFVLEHLDDPSKALSRLRGILKTGGTITVIEGDHGACVWHPETVESRKVWDCLVEAQIRLGHNPLIGREVHPLLKEAGFRVREVIPRWIYTDGRNPERMDAGVNRIIVPMVATARAQSIESGMVDERTWEKGLGDLSRVAASTDGSFFYTWFKGTAWK